MKSKHGHKKGSQNGAGKLTAEQPIPRKRKGGDKNGKDTEKATSDDREPLKGDHLCTRCKKWSPYVKYTHDTKDCLRWDADGSRLSCKATAKCQCWNNYAKMQKELAEMAKFFA